MTLGADELKEASFWDFIYLNIPKRWECIREPEGNWGCYEPNEDSGTLWVDFDVFMEEERKPETDEDFTPGMHNGYREFFAPKPGVSESYRDPNHLIFHFTSESVDEEGDNLHFDHFRHVWASRPYTALVHLSLVIPVENMEDEWILRLRSFMGEELKNAMIDWPNFPKK